MEKFNRGDVLICVDDSQAPELFKTVEYKCVEDEREGRVRIMLNGRRRSGRVSRFVKK